MKVQTRLSLFSSIVFGVVFGVLALMIYYLHFGNTKKAIYLNLEKIAEISAFFYLEEDELSAVEFEKIREQFKEIVPDSCFQFYDMDNQIVFGLKSVTIPDATLDKIRHNEPLSFAHGQHLCYGMYYEDNQGDFVVIAMEERKSLDEPMNRLAGVLLSSFFIGILAIVLLSRWLSHLAYRPFANVIGQVKNISTQNLDVKIDSPQTNDELQNLIDTFNELLGKIYETVSIQKNFASYVSHEFKTTLASMLGNLEVFSIKDRTPKEYEQLSAKLIKQVLQLEEILNTLSIISDLRENTKPLEQTRIDELVWEIIEKVTDGYPNSNILVHIHIEPVDEPLLFVTIDRTQLLMALFNLIENAVKFSKGQPIDVDIYKQENKLFLTIKDNGIGIPSGQLKHISKPFYRAGNTNQIQGCGIGLSIALRILEKNQIEYRIDSKINTGTSVSLNF